MSYPCHAQNNNFYNYIMFLLMSDSIWKMLQHHFVSVNHESMTSELILNEGVTMPRTCPFVTICEVYCSVVPRIMQWKLQCFIISLAWKFVLAGWLKVGHHDNEVVGGTAKGIAKWTFSRVVIFLTIKEHYLGLWHPILFYSTWEVPNFMTVKQLDSRSTWNHIHM